MLRVSSSHESFEIVYASSEFESRVRKICWKLGEFEWSSSQNSSLTRVLKLFLKILVDLLQLHFKKTHRIPRNSKIYGIELKPVVNSREIRQSAQQKSENA